MDTKHPDTTVCVGCGIVHGKTHGPVCVFRTLALNLDLGKGVWYLCKGCGGRIGFFPVGFTGRNEVQTLPPGACAHTKPVEKVGIPDSTECALYRNNDPFELWVIHERETPIEQPSEMVMVE